MKKNNIPTAEDFNIPEGGNEGIDAGSFKNKIELLENRITELHKIVHDKGLEIGMPAQLNFDIQRIASVITGIIKEMPDANSSEQKDEENDIIKTANRGDSLLALHKMTLKCQRFEKKLYEVKSNLNLLLQVLAMFQSRLASSETYYLKKT